MRKAHDFHGRLADDGHAGQRSSSMRFQPIQRYANRRLTIAAAADYASAFSDAPNAAGHGRPRPPMKLRHERPQPLPPRIYVNKEAAASEHRASTAADDFTPMPPALVS